ncbi:MAG: Fosmidomycin resistance protein, partial [uncultured Acetobacteraceae bacterium]
DGRKRREEGLETGRNPHARAGLGRALGQPLPPARAAAAVPHAARRHGRGLRRTRPRPHAVQRGHGAGAGTDGPAGGPARGAAGAGGRARAGGAGAGAARALRELRLAARGLGAARRGERRVPPRRLRHALARHRRGAHRPRLLHPHLRRLPRRRAGARGDARHGRAARAARGVGRGRPAGAARRDPPRPGAGRGHRTGTGQAAPRRVGGPPGGRGIGRRADPRGRDADRVLHPAQPVHGRRAELLRGGAGRRARRVLRRRHRGPHRLAVPERARRAGGRRRGRPHAPARRGGGARLRRHGGLGAARRAGADAGRGVGGGARLGRLPRRDDHALARHAGARRVAARRHRPHLRRRHHRLQHRRRAGAGALRLAHGPRPAARGVPRRGGVHGADDAAGLGERPRRPAPAGAHRRAGGV